jgi:uncharacterized repeat protein (TIGR01451 family)
MARVPFAGIRPVYLFVFILAAAFPAAASISSNGSGNWNSAATWSPAQIPTATDDVIIQPGHTVTIPSSYAAAANSLVINGTSTAAALSINNSGASLTVTNGVTFTAASSGLPINSIDVGAGALTCSNLTMNAGTGTARLTVDSGSLTVTGNVAFSGTVSNVQLQFTSGTSPGTMNFGGDLPSGNTFSAGSGTVNFNGSGSQNVAGYAYFHVTVNKSGGSVKLTGGTSISSQLDINSGTFNDGGQALTLSTAALGMSGGTFEIEAANAPSAASYSLGGGTISYSSSGNQTVSSSIAYRSLRIENKSGAGVSTKTANGALTVNLNLDVTQVNPASAVLALGANNLDVAGAVTNDGTISATTGIFNLTGTSSNVTGSGSFSGGTVNFSGSTKTILAAANLSFTGAITVDSTCLVVNNGTVTASGTSGINGLAGGSAWQNKGTLSVGGPLMTTGLLDVTTAGNTVGYSRNDGGTQVVKAANYYHLNLGGSGTKDISSLSEVDGNLTLTGPLSATVSGNLIVYGNMTITAGATFNGSSWITAVLGNWTVSGGGTFVPATSTIEFYGSGAGSVSGSTFHNLLFDGAGTKTLAAGLQADDITIANTGNLATNGQTVNVLGNFTNNSSTNFNATGTYIFSGSSAQSISGLGTTFDSLTISNASGVTVNVPVTVTGTLALNSGIVAGTSTVSVNSGGSISRVSGYVSAPLRLVFSAPSTKTYYTGSSTTYMPVTLTSAGAADVSVKAVDGQHPNRRSSNILARYWTIGQNSGSSFTLSFTWSAGDVTGLESTYLTGRYASSAWTEYASTVTPATHSASISGVTALSGDWTVGDTTAFISSYTVTTTADSGLGSLRAAITDANSGTCGSGCWIKFAIGSGTQTIQPTSALPTIAVPVTIDGTTQTGYSGAPLIEIDGSLAGGSSSGLTFSASDTLADSKLAAIVINRFAQNGVLINGSGGRVSIGNCRIGTNVAGTGAQANGGAGILIAGSPQNIIGSATDGNLIAYNSGVGVVVTGSGSALIRGNAIHHNGSRAIDLGNDGATANDAGDSDSGADGLQNYPLLANAILTSGTTLTLDASVDSSSRSATLGMVVDVFKADPSSPSQALTYLGSSACVASNTLVSQPLSFTVSGVVSGDKLVATATSYADASCLTIADGTSEVSAAATIISLPGVTAIRPATGSIAGGQSVMIDGSDLDTVTSATFGGLPATIAYSSPSQLTLDAPAHASGTVAISLTNPAGPTTINSAYAYATDDDAARDFSADVNPHGNWTLGSEASRGATFTAFSTHQHNANGIDYWPSGAPALVGRNYTTAPVSSSSNITPALGLILHPGAFGEYAVMRWTAPAAGSYRIAGNFTGIDTNGTTTDVAILHNNDGVTPLFSTNVTGYNTPFAFSQDVTVPGGDTIEFTVGYGTNSNWSNDATGLTATITPLTGSTVTITGVTPTGGSSGQAVTINGTNFHASATVTFGGVAATSVVVVNSNTITCITPAHAGGPVDVTVTHTDSAAVTSNAAYLYVNNVHWTGGAANGLWSSAGNWSGGSVPGTYDNAYVDLAGTYTITSSAAISVHSLQLGAISGTQTLQSNAGISVATSSTVGTNGVLTQAGNLSGTGDLTVAGLMTFNGTSTLNVSVNSGATLTVTTGYAIFDGVTLTNLGTVNLNATGFLRLQSAATLANGSLVDILGDTVIDVGAGGGSIDNNGILRKSAGSGTASISATLGLSGGSLLAQSGTLSVGSGSSTGGTITVTGSLIFQGTFTLDAASTLSGSGNVTFAGSVTSVGTFNITGTTVVQSGTSTIGGTVVSLGGTVSVNSGTLTLNNPTPITVATFTLAGGIYGGSGSVTLSGTTQNWTGGTLTGSGAFTIPATVTVNHNGPSYLIFDGRPVTNAGTLNIVSFAPMRLQSGASITNSGMLDLQGDGSVLDVGAGGGNIFNSGTVRKGGGVATSSITATLHNNGGTVTVVSGTLSLGDGASTGGSYSAAAGRAISFNGGGSLTLDATSSVSGAGDFTLGSTAVNSLGTWNVTGTTHAPSGTHLLSGNVTSLGSVLDLQGGTVTVNNAAPLSVASLNINSGTLSQSGSLTVTGVSTWTSGTLSGSGGLTLAGTSVTQLNSSYVAIDTRPMTNAGSMAFTAPGANLRLQNGAALTNSGTIALTSNGGIDYAGGGGTLINNGSLIKSAGTASNIGVSSFTNGATGIVTASSAALTFTQPFTNAGTLAFAISGASTFGTMAINGGAFTMGGTLLATTSGGYTPANGTTFNVMTFATPPVGSFAQSLLTYTGGQFTPSTSASALTLTAGAPTCATAPSGIVSWWRAEGNAGDSVGPNLGTLQNGASFGAGNSGSAFTFDGVSQHVTVADAASLHVSDLTVETWVKFNSIPTAAQFVGKTFGSATAASFALWYQSGTLNGGVNVSGPGALSAAWTPVTNTWYHLALTYDSGTQTATLYLDGAPVVTAAMAAPIVYDGNSVLIGADSDFATLDNFFPGLIDEVTLYGRALSASEVLGIYAASTAGKCYSAPAAPAVTGFSPGNGAIGSSVTVNGSNLTTTYGVAFNGTPATSISGNSASAVTAIVPAGATSGPITVTTAGGSANSSGSFTVGTLACDVASAFGALPPSVATGGTVNANVTTTNYGPNAATATMSFSVSGGTVASMSYFGWSTCTQTSTTVNCSATSIGTLSSAFVNVGITATAAAGGNVTLAATSSASGDTNAGNDSATASVSVVSSADLVVTPGVSPSTVAVGGPLTYSATVSNIGPSAATGVTFTLQLPANVNPNGAATTSQGTCSGTTTVTCTVGVLPAAGSVNITVPALAISGGSATAFLAGSANESDPNPGNNSALSSTATVTSSTLTVTSNNPSGNGTLQQAILDANANICTAPCTIAFNLPGGSETITVTAPLPAISANNVTIDGTTNPTFAGTPVVTLDGSGETSGTPALVITGNNVAVRGLSIIHFPAAGGMHLAGNSNTLSGNWIGVTPAGIAGGNANAGIHVTGSFNTIGGTTAAARNVISANAGAGIVLDGATATNNNVYGNVIGLLPDGTTPAGNAADGVQILNGASNNGIGNGSLAGSGNVLSGNANAGVYLTGPTTSGSNTVAGNRIGTDVAGTAARANGNGIWIDGGTDQTLVGGTGANDGNTISGNSGAGVVLAGGASNAKLLGNRIGTDVAGTSPLPNNTGVYAQSGANHDFVGAAGAGNVIAYNSNIGVKVLGATAIGIVGNSIHDNLTGIDLGANGATANDAGDSDTGDNGLQNFPTFVDASVAGGNLSLHLNVDSANVALTASLRVDVFKASNGQGLQWLGGQCVGGNSLTNFALSFPGSGVTSGNTLVATATSYADASCAALNDGTSEFSAPFTVTGCVTAPATITASGPTSFCTGGSVTLTASAGSSFLWSNGATTQSMTVTAAGSYSVAITDGTGCSAVSAPVTITLTAQPTVTATAGGPTTFCSGGSVTLTANASGGSAPYSYQWRNGASPIPSANGASYTATSGGAYSVVVTGSDGCASAQSNAVTVTVTANTPATITANGPTSFCTGGSVTLTASAGASWLWSNGATTQSILVNASGSYSVQVTNGSCAPATSAPTVVTVTAPPAVTITGPSSVCPNTPFTLDAGPGFATYLWSTGATTRTITISQTAPSVLYGVTVSNGSCPANTNKPVTTNPGPTAILSAPSSLTPNATGNSASVNPGPAGTTYSWSISGGSITSGSTANAITFDAGPSGSVVLTVGVTFAGCSASSSVTIPIAANAADLSLAMTATPPQPALGANATFTLQVSNAGPASAVAVNVTATLPANLTFVSANGSGWTCNPFANSVTCSAQQVSFGTASAITIVASGNANGDAEVQATASSSTQDPDASNNSASASVTVGGQPANCSTTPAALSSPADGANAVATPVAFSWSAVPGAAHYELWIASGNSGAVLAASTASTSASVNVPAGKSRWYVVTHLAAECTPTVSQTRTFTAAQSANCDHDAPQLTSPSNDAAVSSPVTFAWQPVAGAIGYRVWVKVDGAAAQDLGSTTTATSLTAALTGAKVAWYVEAIFGGCPSRNSAESHFTMEQADPCASRASASPVAPAPNATLQTSAVDFRWSSVAGSHAYRLWFAVDGAAPQSLPETGDTTAHATIASGHVDWYVDTLFDGCASTESAHAGFTIPKAEECPTIAAVPSAPVANSTTNSPLVTFTWSPAPNAVAYDVFLALGDSAPALIGSTDATSLTRAVAPGALQWFVRTTFTGCPPVDSARLPFTFAPPPECSSARPLLTAPSGPNAVVVSPAGFSWGAVPGAKSYKLYLSRNHAAFTLAASTPQTHVSDLVLAAGNYEWNVEAQFDGGCPAAASTPDRFTVIPTPPACAAPQPPTLRAGGEVSSSVAYTVRWSPAPNADHYELQESASPGFDGASVIATTANELHTSHANSGATTVSYFYRVRTAGTCDNARSLYSAPISVSVLPQQQNGGAADGATPADDPQDVTYFLQIGGNANGATKPIAATAGTPFTATANEPWLTVTPTSGIVGPDGTTLTVTAKAGGLPVGTNTGGVTVTFGATAQGHLAVNGGTSSTSTVSVNLVQPVTPSTKNTPPPDALIIPAVAHADGINSTFESDVRVTNTSPQVMKYNLTFTPSGEEGPKNAKQTQIDIDPGKTLALDDVLRSWFSVGATTGGAGTLEIRPLTQTAATTSSQASSGVPNIVTFAASRTFNTTANGTFGQYIPAIPFANFVGKGGSLLTLQQVAQSAAYRTNLGLVEGSGDPATVLITAFGDDGGKLTEFTQTLAGGQHLQLNSILAQKGVTVNDGRVEVKVTSATGKVTAYASVLDNATNDPLLVSPVAVAQLGATKYVIPGVADLANGLANWQTDVRVYNASSKSVSAIATFYPAGGGESQSRSLQLGPNEVKQLDGALRSLFNLTNTGGALHIATETNSTLVATARTYNLTSNGTYGQFIPAVTPNEAVGLGQRPLQLLQIEESDRFRTNIGIAEVTGKPVVVDVTAVPPDSKVAAHLTIELGPNEFRQYGSLLKSLGIENAYNARVTVKVTEGQGRVTAYASVIDAETQDPTYVNAQ